MGEREDEGGDVVEGDRDEGREEREEVKGEREEEGGDVMEGDRDEGREEREEVMGGERG